VELCKHGRYSSALDETVLSALSAFDCPREELTMHHYIPTFLRRRPLLSWFILPLTSYALYRTTMGSPMLSSNLPRYTGQFDVGTIDIEAPCKPRRIGDYCYKESGEAAFELETVLFSVFYPSVKGAVSSKPKHRWISNSTVTGEGYARFANIHNTVTNKIFSAGLHTLVGSTTIPAEVDVPLHGTPSSKSEAERKDSLQQFPIVIFSHGMASSRTDYTHYLGEIASRGYVVAAIEHRDGSCPGTSVMLPDGTSKTVFHTKVSGLRWRGQHESADIRPVQLEMRQVEVEETLRVLRSIANGKGSEVYGTNTRGEGGHLASWKGRLNLDMVIMAGHSYGATLALQALKDAPSPQFPFKAGIALDPGKHSGELNSHINVPILVVHSNTWSKHRSVFFGRPHFDTVKDLVQGVLDKVGASWFITSMGTSHPSVTDAPLIEPWLFSWTTSANINVHEGVRQYVQVGVDFLNFMMTGKKDGLLSEAVTHPQYDNDTRSKERKHEMEHGIGKYWQIHVAPSA
jgi:platelet-activating factor acetylhydrolase